MSVVSSFWVLVLRTMEMVSDPISGLTVLPVPVFFWSLFNHRWYCIVALEVLSRDGCGFCISPTWMWESPFDSVG